MCVFSVMNVNEDLRQTYVLRVRVVVVAVFEGLFMLSASFSTGQTLNLVKIVIRQSEQL